MNSGARLPERRMNMLVIYAGLIPSVEISVLIPLRHLAQLGKIELHAGTVSELDLKKELSYCDLIVFSRCCMPEERVVLELVQCLGIPYIYDLDDNFFRLAEAKDPSQPFLQWEGIMDNLKDFLSGACLVKTGSQQLVDDMKPYNTNIVIHPYVFDFDLIAEKQSSRLNKKETVIGYAGSLAHGSDLQQISGALTDIAHKYGSRVRFEFYGAKPDGADRMDAELLERSSFIPYQPNYSSFIRDVSGRNWDIALAPLADNIANRSKTNNKYREYAACGIAGVYSAMPVYQASITDGINGMLADYTQDSWTEKIEALILDDELRQSIISNAYADVRTQCHIDSVSRLWFEEIILPYASDQEKQTLRERKIQSLGWRITTCWRLYKRMSWSERMRMCKMAFKRLVKKALGKRGVRCIQRLLGR